MNAPFFVDPDQRERRGFTMTELLVVIGIIAVLAGILLVAMGGVRRKALQTETLSTMVEFSKACDAFQIEQGHYPGVLPEQVLANQSFQGIPPISGTENALLGLMGGYAVLAPGESPANDPDFGVIGQCADPGIVCPNLGSTNWQLKIDINRFGEGPRIGGRPWAPYFTPKESQLSVARGQLRGVGAGECCPQIDDCSTGSPPCLPDLLDAWGQPILYVRRARTTGLLVGTVQPPTGQSQPQFYMDSMNPYLKSTGLGQFRKDQQGGSILNLAPDKLATFAQIIRHPSLGASGTADAALNGTAQGAYVLISAGRDGIYFSAKDGPGTPKSPVVDIVLPPYGTTPTIVKQYDDILIFGGG